MSETLAWSPVCDLSRFRIVYDGEVALVFDAVSGQTHVLYADYASTLEAIGCGSFDLASLAATLEAEHNLDVDHDSFADDISPILTQLDNLGLISRVL